MILFNKSYQSGTNCFVGKLGNFENRLVLLCFARISETRRGEREEKISNLNFFALSTFSSLKLQLAITLIKIIFHYPTHGTFISIVVYIQQCHQEL